MEALTTAVFLPMELHAFVINPKVCESTQVRIAPVTRPEYAGLGIDGKTTAHDVLPRIDVSLSHGASQNPRICRYGEAPTEPTARDRCASKEVDPRRTGVHLSWRLPSCYRIAYSKAQKAVPHGQKEPTTSKATYPTLPVRWLVVRRMEESTPGVPDGTADSSESPIRKVEMWVVESDRQFKIKELPLGVDLEMDVSPFLSNIMSDDRGQLKTETQSYVGQRSPWNDWVPADDAPRVSMSNVAGSNPYFLDCAMHNVNVLSFFDNLTYIDFDKQEKYFKYAKCSYTVLGLHDLHDDDPICGSHSVYGPPVGRDQPSIEQRLGQMGIKNVGAVWTSLQPGLTANPDAVVSTHPLGKISDVVFHNEEAPSEIPAETFASAFSKSVETEPIGVGGTTLDALIALLRAHKDALGSNAEKTVSDLLALQELIVAVDGDDYDSRIQANDYLQTHIYRDLPGEQTWRLEPSKGQQQNITGMDKELQHLRNLNEQQRLYAAVSRRIKSCRWLLFAEFFKFVASPSVTGDQSKSRQRVENCRQVIARLSGQLKTISSRIIDLVDTKLQKSKGLVKAAGPNFAQRKDPSLCFAGLKVSGIVTDKNKLVGYTYQDFTALFESPMVGNLYKWDESTMSKRASPKLLEFLECIPRLIGQPISDIHDFISKGWNDTQAWSPLYLEWEVEYFHIPKEKASKWSVMLRSRADGTNHSHLHYEIKDFLPHESTNTLNRRRFVGRSTLVPQVGFSLRSIVDQILQRRGLTSGGQVLPPGIKSRTEFLDTLDTLPLASATLSGFTAHLLTRNTGMHVKPNYWDQDQNFHGLKSAEAAGSAIGLDAEDLKLMEAETAQTPYGDLADFSTSVHNPFVGVTHGQFVIRRLDIVDSFGQVVTAPLPHLSQETPQGNPHHVHPCISDLLSPGRNGSQEFNTILPCTETYRQGSQPLCPFIQLPPTINQPARLNVNFVVPASGVDNPPGSWRSTTEWENPIWGWVIMNLADQAFQLYTSEGIFVTQFGFGGSNGIRARARWLPFKPPESMQAQLSPKLKELVERMAGRGGAHFLNTFWDTIVSAAESIPYAPADYVVGTSAIIGRPLALVDVGISLELSDAPIEAQHNTTTGPSRVESEAEIMFGYKFEYKLGDTERPYDGVLGFFDCKPGSTATDLSRIYAPLASSKKSTLEIFNIDDPAHFDTVSPYWINPLEDFTTRSYTQMHDDQFLRQGYKPNVKSVIVDPYAPIHVYSGVLPSISAELPRRFVQGTLSKMTAFYTAGPIALPKDVPATFEPAAEPNTISWIKRGEILALSTDEARVRLPFKAIKGDWLWLQPYAAKENPVKGDKTTPEWEWCHYDALEVGPENTMLGQLQAPPAVVEGYLQLARPLAKPEEKENDSLVEP